MPVPPMLLNVLREWKLQCPTIDLDLAFPSCTRRRRDGSGVGGTIGSLSNIVQREFVPAQVRAGVVDKNGKPKYTGLHALRHFYASWCINRKEDGGLALPPKVVQHRLGHSSITMTMDTYGHLFPRGDDGTELAAAEKALLG